MTTEVAQKSSSFFPVGVKSQEESKIPVRCTALVSFPQTRKVLWDSERIGSKMVLDLFPGRDITVNMSEKALRLAYQHAAHEKGSQYRGFLVGMVETNAEEEGIEISLNRFDPGREHPSGQGPVLTAKLPGDFAVPICLSFSKGDGMPPHREADFLSAFKFVDHSISSRGEVELLNILSLRIHCLLYDGSEDITFSLHLGAVVAGTSFEVGQIHPLPVIPTALARNLSGPVSISKLQKNHKFGYLTMDQTRKLLLLLDTDPKAYSLPLVGIWVSGVNYVHSPLVYAACLKYLFSKSIQDRATSPSGGFILLLYTPLNKQPLFFECQRRDNSHNLTFDLIGCKEQLHMYKHGNNPAASIQVELTGARDGPSKELFLQTLKKFEANLGFANFETTSGTVSDPHLLPRPSPKPILTKSPSIIPSVPEVSLIFDNSENHIQVKRSSTSVGELRPGPLRDLNQSQSQLQMRTGFVTPKQRRFSVSSSEGHPQDIRRSEQDIERRLHPARNCKQEDEGSEVAGRKGKKKKGSSGKKSKARTEQRDTKDGSTHSGQETKIPDSSVLQMNPNVREENESNECRNNKQEDVLMRGRNGEQGEGSNPESVPQSQAYLSAMPHRSLQLQGQIKQRQLDSDFRYNTSANVPLNGEWMSNSTVGYVSSTIQRNESKHQSSPHTSTKEPIQDRLLLQSPHHSTGVVRAGLFSQPPSQPHSQQQSPPDQRRFNQGSCEQQSTQPTLPDQSRYQQEQQRHQLGRDCIGNENNKQMESHQRDGLREESTFDQLRKQEKMIEQLQEQIKYLLQIQAGSISPGLLTPPATPPSGKGCPGFAFPTPDSRMEDRKPRSDTFHTQKEFGQTTTKWELPTPKQVASVSTNTGQSLFFPESSLKLSPRQKTKRCSPNSSLGDEKGQHESHQQYPASPPSNGGTKSPSSSLGEDHHHTPRSRGSSAQGSVSDAGLSTDPDFQVELENTNDDTHSLGKVEMRSFPDSGSSKSSPQSSPSRSHGQQNFSKTPQNSSPGSGDNTMVTSPPMPTLVSPVLGESASTCQPQMTYHQSCRKGSPSGMRQGFGWTDVIEEESEEGFAVNEERLQSPSLLQRDQKQFYQNLLGQVENFLQDDEDNDDCQGEIENENSDEEEDDADDDEWSSETSDEETEEMPFNRDCGRSILFSPDVHPHINYISLADFGLGPSDVSIEADAIAMKYLSDEELAKISTEMKSDDPGGDLRDGVNPLLRAVLTAGLPSRLLNDKSTLKSRLEFSFATRKYLEKHGLENSVVRDDTHQRKKKRKRKKRQKDEARMRKEEPKQQQEQQPEFERIFNQEGKLGQHQKNHGRLGEQAVSIGNILDLNKLKTLPKLL